MKVCLVSFSPIRTDGRIRRHGDLLHANGYDVVGVGFGGPAADIGWPVVEVPDAPWGAREKTLLAGRLVRARAGRASAESAYWASWRHRAMYDAARPVSADLYVANDWNALPVAARIAAETGAGFAYDSHEYAVEERADRWKWRLLWPPYLAALESAYIRDAAYVSTVSDGIAGLLQRDYGLAQRPAVIRNAPRYQPIPLADPHEPLTVLFHGTLQRDRGLEILIDSVASWGGGRRLVIRGSAEPRYVDALNARAQRNGVSELVSFVPPVPAADVVSCANATADIGIHPMPAITNQTRFALPNKFFEYTMAGLAVSVMAGTEMATLVERYGTGVSIAEPTAEAVADAINRLDVEAVRGHKVASLAAAKDLSWEQESERLLAIYREL